MIVAVSSARSFEVEHWHISEEVELGRMLKPIAANSTASLEKLIPTDYALHQNYPNPFNPSTQINFDLPEPGNVSLVIYDVLGREVANLADGYHEAGYHSATWNAADESIASGVYFARFTVTDAVGQKNYAKINKLVLMK